MQNRKQAINTFLEKHSKPITIGFYLLFFALCSLLMSRMLGGTTTIQYHIDYARELADGHKKLPHLGYFYLLWGVHWVTGLSFELAGCFTLGLLGTLNAAAVHFVFRKLLPDFTTFFLLFLTGVTMLVAALYLPFFNKAVYYGQGSPNMWHNSTVIAVKAISILAFYLSVKYLESKELQRSFSFTATISFLLLLSVFVKPIFIIVILPAIGLVILFRHLKNAHLYLKAALIGIPSLLLLYYQSTFLASSIGDLEGGRTNTFAFLKIWPLFTPNVIVSILLANAFPFAIAAFRYKQVKQTTFLPIAWLLWLVGMLQFALIAEYSTDGELIKAGNWIGGYLMGLSLVFLFSMVEFARWIKEVDIKNLSEKLKIGFTIFLLTWHFFSGVYYIFELFFRQKTLLLWY